MSRLTRITVVNDFRGYQVTVWQRMPQGTPHVLTNAPDLSKKDLTLAHKVFGTVTGENQIITLEQIARVVEELPDLLAYKITTSDGNGVLVDYDYE